MIKMIDERGEQGKSGKLTLSRLSPDIVLCSLTKGQMEWVTHLVTGTTFQEVSNSFIYEIAVTWQEVIIQSVNLRESIVHASKVTSKHFPENIKRCQDSISCQLVIRVHYELSFLSNLILFDQTYIVLGSVRPEYFFPPFGPAPLLPLPFPLQSQITN